MTRVLRARGRRWVEMVASRLRSVRASALQFWTAMGFLVLGVCAWLAPFPGPLSSIDGVPGLFYDLVRWISTRAFEVFGPAALILPFVLSLWIDGRVAARVAWRCLGAWAGLALLLGLGNQMTPELGGGILGSTLLAALEATLPPASVSLIATILATLLLGWAAGLGPGLAWLGARLLDGLSILGERVQDMLPGLRRRIAAALSRVGESWRDFRVGGFGNPSTDTCSATASSEDQEQRDLPLRRAGDLGPELPTVPIEGLEIRSNARPAEGPVASFESFDRTARPRGVTLVEAPAQEPVDAAAAVQHPECSAGPEAMAALSAAREE